MANGSIESLKATPLRRWRDQAGFTLEDVAGLTGASTAAISLIERGLRNPSPRMKVQIARGLGVSVGELFTVEQLVDGAA